MSRTMGRESSRKSNDRSLSPTLRPNRIRKAPDWVSRLHIPSSKNTKAPSKSTDILNWERARFRVTLPQVAVIRSHELPLSQCGPRRRSDSLHRRPAQPTTAGGKLEPVPAAQHGCRSSEKTRIYGSAVVCSNELIEIYTPLLANLSQTLKSPFA